MKFKEKILTIPDDEYRNLDDFSYSLLKALDDSGPLSLITESTKSGDALEFGSLVDILITSPERKDDVFWTKTLVKPTASLLELADAILLDILVYEDTLQRVTHENIQDKIKELKLWDNVKDIEKLKAKYDVQLFWDYIKESYEAKGKIIVSPEVLESAENCAKVLLNHEYTNKYFIETDTFEVLKQASVRYNFKGVTGKARIDLLNIDHKKKEITVIDIKTGAELPTKFMAPFYKYKYYLQVVSYLLAIQYIINNDPDFGDYTINDFKFIYLSKKLPEVPSIWTVPTILLNKFADGWVSSSGDRVRGFMELVEDYKFHKESQYYSTERLIVQNNGNMKIELL